MSNLITAKNVCLSYLPQKAGLRSLFSKTAPMPLALDNINFDLKEGERLALVGLNGSGKSTLLRIIAGIYPLTSGDIEISGKVVALFNLGIGMRMDLSGRKNIILQGMANGLSLEQITLMVPEIIEFSELNDVIDAPILTYSQGMAMRLSFAIATAIKPEILLLDEWIGAGDRVFRAKAQNRLESMLEESRGLVLASHNTHIVRRYCTKAIWLNKGKVMAHGNMEDVLDAFVEATD